MTYNSTTTCSTGSSIAFTGIRNGSWYTYSIGHVANYSLSGSYTGSGTISGGGGQGQIVKTVRGAVEAGEVHGDVHGERALGARELAGHDGRQDDGVDGIEDHVLGVERVVCVHGGGGGIQRGREPPEPSGRERGSHRMTVTFTATVPHGSPAAELVAARA